MRISWVKDSLTSLYKDFTCVLSSLGICKYGRILHVYVVLLVYYYACLQ